EEDADARLDVVERRAEVGREVPRVERLEAALLGGEAQREARVGERLLALLDLFDVVLLQALAVRARRAEQDAAAERHHRRERAHEEAVARARDDRFIQLDLDERLLAGQELLLVEDAHASEHLARPEVDAHLGPVLERALAAG